MSEQTAKPKYFTPPSVIPSQFKTQNAGNCYTEWVITAPVGLQREDILRPEYWVNVARHMHDNDKIEVISDGGEWVEHYRVHYIDKPKEQFSDPIVHVRFSWSEKDRDAGDELQVPEGFEVRWTGPNGLWAAKRLSDGRVLESKFSAKPAAVAWLHKHVGSKAAA